MKIKTLAFCTTFMTCLLPGVAKSQNALLNLKKGEKVFATKPSVLKHGKECMIYFSGDNCAKRATKATLLCHDTKAPNIQGVYLANSQSNITSISSQSVDSIIISSRKIQDSDVNIDQTKYYISGRVYRQAVIRNEKGEPIAYITDNNSGKECVRTEVPENIVRDVTSQISVPTKRECLEYSLVKKTENE